MERPDAAHDHPPLPGFFRQGEERPQSPMLAEQLRSRVTLVSRTYYQNHSQQPFSVEDAYSYQLLSQDEPYQWRTRLSPISGWVPLDTGWLGTNVGLVHIANDVGRHDRQEEADPNRVLVVGLWYAQGDVVLPLVHIAPTHSFQARLLSPENLRIRCLHPGGATCTVSSFPR